MQWGHGGVGVRGERVDGGAGAGRAAARAPDRVDGAPRLPVAGAGQGREERHGCFTGTLLFLCKNDEKNKSIIITIEKMLKKYLTIFNFVSVV